MSSCMTGGWVGGWVIYTFVEKRVALLAKGEAVGSRRRWMGGWVGGWVGGLPSLRSASPC